MKKIILSLVFVFTMGTMVNANSENSLENGDSTCFEFAEGIQDIYEQTHPYATHRQSFNEFINAYDDCVANAQVY